MNKKVKSVSCSEQREYFPRVAQERIVQEKKSCVSTRVPSFPRQRTPVTFPADSIDPRLDLGQFSLYYSCSSIQLTLWLQNMRPSQPHHSLSRQSRQIIFFSQRKVPPPPPFTFNLIISSRHRVASLCAFIYSKMHADISF